MHNFPRKVFLNGHKKSLKIWFLSFTILIDLTNLPSFFFQVIQIEMRDLQQCVIEIAAFLLHFFFT